VAWTLSASYPATDEIDRDPLGEGLRPQDLTGPLSPRLGTVEPWAKEMARISEDNGGEDKSRCSCCVEWRECGTSLDMLSEEVLKKQERQAIPAVISTYSAPSPVQDSYSHVFSPRVSFNLQSWLNLQSWQ
jgi:hypothetical protein